MFGYGYFRCRRDRFCFPPVTLGSGSQRWTVGEIRHLNNVKTSGVNFKQTLHSAKGTECRFIKLSGSPLSRNHLASSGVRLDIGYEPKLLVKCWHWWRFQHKRSSLFKRRKVKLLPSLETLHVNLSFLVKVLLTLRFGGAGASELAFLSVVSVIGGPATQVRSTWSTSLCVRDVRTACCVKPNEQTKSLEQAENDVCWMFIASLSFCVFPYLPGKYSTGRTPCCVLKRRFCEQSFSHQPVLSVWTNRSTGRRWQTQAQTAFCWACTGASEPTCNIQTDVLSIKHSTVDTRRVISEKATVNQFKYSLTVTNHNLGRFFFTLFSVSNLRKSWTNETCSESLAKGRYPTVN